MPALLPPSGRFGASPSPRSELERWAERVRVLFLTPPGTLPWRPDLGLDLQWLLGQPLHGLHINLVRMRVRAALTRFLPAVEVQEIEVTVHSTFSGYDARPRGVPLAEAALLPYGAGGRLEIRLSLTTPAGPLALDLDLLEHQP